LLSTLYLLTHLIKIQPVTIDIPVNLSNPLLNDEEVQLLSTIHASEDKKLSVYFGIRGIVYLNQEENIYKNGLDYYEALLKGLEKKGLIEKTDSSFNIFCPNCNYPNVYSRYSCPTCKSMNLKQVQIIQHSHCGYIGPKITLPDTKQVQCPKCNTIITESQELTRETYQRVGFHFECVNNHRFSRPDITHLCPACEARFDYKESNYRPLYDYTLTEKAYQLLRQDKDIDSFLIDISSMLTQLGYQAVYEDKIIGFSSSEHTIPLTGTKNEKVTLFGVSITGDKDDLIQLLGKKMDIENSSAVFLDAYGNKELASLGQVYNIMIVDLTAPTWQNKLKQWLTENDPARRNVMIRRTK